MKYLKLSINHFEQAKVKINGVILNDVERGSAGYGYAYAYKASKDKD